MSPANEDSAGPIEGALARAWSALEAVADPEIPVLSIVDLGIVRSVDVTADGELRVGLSPTYTGCPATAVIRTSVETALRGAGFDRLRIANVLAPPWTSDWITDRGRRRLREFGIDPPAAFAAAPTPPVCPRCGSLHTRLLSEFGSTPCKSLYRCEDCLEPFDRFKCI